jgi:hypothetical protein
MNENEIMEMENEMEEFEDCEIQETTENSGNGILGKVLLGTVLAGGAVAAILYKNRKKLEAKKIERLRKKGYVIYKPEEDMEEIEDQHVFEEVEDEE